MEQQRSSQRKKWKITLMIVLFILIVWVLMGIYQFAVAKSYKKLITVYSDQLFI